MSQRKLVQKKYPNRGRIRIGAIAPLRYHAVVRAPIWGCDTILHWILGDLHPTSDASSTPLPPLTPIFGCSDWGIFGTDWGTLLPKEGARLPGEEILKRLISPADFTRTFYLEFPILIFGNSNIYFIWFQNDFFSFPFLFIIFYLELPISIYGN